MRINQGLGLGLTMMACLVGSCAHTGKVSQQRYECTDRLARAVKKFDAGKYGSAKTILDDVKQQCAGHRIMDSVEYYLAMSLVRMKMYDEAKLEFTRLTQDFPRSPFFYEAEFRIGYCVLKSSLPVERDQTETRDAQRLFTDFLQNYPASDFADSAQRYLKLCVNKLAEKEFASAKFYQRIGEKEAAIVYYKVFINDYPASQFTSQARLNMGQMLIELSRKAEAREVLDALVAEEKSGDIARKAQELLSRCKE
ncbi:MAG: outer membrane protein assembly factor BamD [Chitinispirillaceae bacterium]|jgi:outer membrane protein assembly factor BamD